MSELDQIRAEVRSELRANAELLYRHQGTWSDGTRCRFSVQDPSKTDSGTRLAQRLAGTDEVMDVLLLRVHPDDPAPGEGAEIAWNGGRAEIVDWSATSDFTGQAVAVCRLTR